jgi:hypothetical protein
MRLRCTCGPIRLFSYAHISSQAIKRQDEAKRSAAESLETPACDDFFKKYKFKANMF